MKPQPKWQRARVMRDRDDPVTVGAFLWVRIGRPRDIEGLWGKCERAVTTNILYDKITPFGWQIDCLELLARDENDFLYDDPPLIPWERFLAECRQAAAHADE